MADDRFARLKGAFAEAMGRHAVPGAALGVLDRGEQSTAALGLTSVEHPLAVDEDTLFLVASNTKPFTATAAMRLVEQGKLDLHAPLRRYVPELRLADEDVAARATLWHCLTHTSGWMGDHAPDTGRGDDAVARAVASMVELPQWTPLGEVWSYNNIGFTLAGRAIEVASGMSYETALRALVLEPLGMSRSTFFAEDAITRGAAAGHNVGGGVPKVVRPWSFPRSANPMGGLISSLRDMLAWARFNLGDGQGLLRPETMALMRTQQAAAGSSCDAVGLSWMLWDVGGTRLFGHGGYAPGQMSALRMSREHEFALVVLTNSDHGARMHGEVVSAAQRIYLGVETPEPSHPSAPVERLGEYAGRYTAPLDDVELTIEDGALRIETTAIRWLTPTWRSEPPREAPPPSRLAFSGEDRVVAIDPPQRGARGEFLRDSDGRIAWLRWGGRIHRREV